MRGCEVHRNPWGLAVNMILYSRWNSLFDSRYKRNDPSERMVFLSAHGVIEVGTRPDVAQLETHRIAADNTADVLW